MQQLQETTDISSIRPSKYAPKGKADQIRRLKDEHPDLSHNQIAKLTDTDPSNVTRVLQRYGAEYKEVERYKRHRADILAGVQARLLKSITQADIEKAPVGSRILAVAQLYDKERLERGKATDIIGYKGMVAQAIVSLDKLKELEAQLVSVGSNPRFEAQNEG